MVVRKAEDYHKVLRLFPPMPEPPFEESLSLEKYWGRCWGADSEVGKLECVLVHRPGDEMKVIDEAKWDSEVGALIDDERKWYWRGEKGPDIDLMKKQHDDFVEIMKQEGVEVVYLKDIILDRPKSVFTRDLGAAVPGGVILGRFAPAMRRGEEKTALSTLGSMSVPILRTIHGSGTFEGGNFALIDRRHAALGYSSRTNLEGVRQVREVLDVLGMELIVVPLTGYALHLDGAFAMVDTDIALVNVTKLPFWFLEKLQELGIRAIEVHSEDNWYAINCVPLSPGKIVMASGSDRTAERLGEVGVQVIQTEFNEILKNGGGPRCSTMPLLRNKL